MSPETRNRLQQALAAEATTWARYERTHRRTHFDAWDAAWKLRERAENAARRESATERKGRP